MTARLLTTPEVIRDHAARLPTGNEYVTLPTISPADGGVERVGVLHMGCAALLELCGPAPAGKQPGSEALLRPTLAALGREVALAGHLGWERVGEWLPRFHFVAGELTLEGTLFAPPGARGFVYALRLERRAGAGAPLRVTLGWRGQWGDTLQTVFTSGSVEGRRCARRDRWTGGPVFELRPGPALLGWALMSSLPLDRCEWSEPHDDAPIALALEKELELAPGASVELALYVGVGREGDGARCAAIDLARRGAPALQAETRGWLARRALALPGAGAPDERRRLEGLATRNQLIATVYSLGRAIDSEELCPVTSRSPLYYVSAAFWARDSLLWSLPALLLCDRELARELLLVAFARHGRNAGVHALYLDGAVLYPGFELDELCAYVVGLGRYLEATGDASLLAEEPVARGLGLIEARLLERRHPEAWLFETFLFPSDDPAGEQRYLAYDNALAARAFELLGEWSARGLWRSPRGADADEQRARAERVRRDLRRHLVVDGPFGPMFAWSTDLGSPPGRELYDEPPGSLQLLAHYGLCAADDPVLCATQRWIRSPHNRYWCAGALAEAGCPHAEHPFVMGLWNSLLSGHAGEARAILLAAPLDGGLACESFDRESGEVRTGPAFATCAGFLAYALAVAFG